MEITRGESVAFHLINTDLKLPLGWQNRVLLARHYTNDDDKRINLFRTVKYTEDGMKVIKRLYDYTLERVIETTNNEYKQH